MLDKLLNLISFRDRFATFETLGGVTLILISMGSAFLYKTELLLTALEGLSELAHKALIPVIIVTGVLGLFLFARNRFGK